MKRFLTPVLALAVLAVFADPAIAQQSWSVAIEQNAMSTKCGSTPNIPVAGATDCTTAKAAAWNLLTTFFQTPNCMNPGCPAGSTITQGVSTCTPDPYTRPNGSPAMRWQVSWTWSCVPPPVSCANPPPATNYNTGSNSANNVPLNQCYMNTVGECLYNFAAPGTVGGWNTGCPPAIAGSNCCGWTALPATSCPGNLIQNGNFTAGLNVLGNGSMSGTQGSPWSTVSNWSAPFNTPQLSSGMGCGNNGFVSMWGNQVAGEAIRQALGAPLVSGANYRFSACVRWLNNSTTLPQYVRFKVRASNGPITYALGGTVIGIIGLTPSTPPPTGLGITSTAWTTFTLQNWTATGSFNTITINPENASSVNSGNQVSWGQIDNVCLQRIP